MLEKSAHDITKPCLLLVEGDDEMHFFDSMLSHIGLREKFTIRVVQGKTNFRKELQTLRYATGFSNVSFIGIVRDTDDDPEAARKSIRSALENEHFDAPKLPMDISDGSVDSPRVSFLLLPSADSSGELEDVLLKSVKGSLEMECVDGFFSCLKNAGIAEPKKFSKARIQAYLASQEDTYPKPGIAARKKCFDFDHQAFLFIKQFLKQIPIPD